MMIPTDIDHMASDDPQIGAFLAEIEAANEALTAGADTYPDGPDAFHARFPEGFKSL
jgi:hypothetical protein